MKLFGAELAAPCLEQGMARRGERKREERERERQRTRESESKKP